MTQKAGPRWRRHSSAPLGPSDTRAWGGGGASEGTAAPEGQQRCVIMHVDIKNVSTNVKLKKTNFTTQAMKRWREALARERLNRGLAGTQLPVAAAPTKPEAQTTFKSNGIKTLPGKRGPTARPQQTPLKRMRKVFFAWKRNSPIGETRGPSGKAQERSR